MDAFKWLCSNLFGEYCIKVESYLIDGVHNVDITVVDSFPDFDFSYISLTGEGESANIEVAFTLALQQVIDRMCREECEPLWVVQELDYTLDYPLLYNLLVKLSHRSVNIYVLEYWKTVWELMDEKYYDKIDKTIQLSTETFEENVRLALEQFLDFLGG